MGKISSKIAPIRPFLDNRVAETPAPTVTSLKPPPVRVGRLDTLARVRREAVKLYTAGRTGEIAAADASRLASVLTLVGTLISATVLEERLASLEERVPW